MHPTGKRRTEVRRPCRILGSRSLQIADACDPPRAPGLVDIGQAMRQTGAGINRQ
jgi:hypothetical protein